MSEGEKRGGGLIVAGGQAAVLLEPVEEAFDFVAVGVQVVVQPPCGAPAALAGHDHRRPGLGNFGDQRVGVVSLISQYGPNGQACQQVRGHGAIGLLARRERQPQRVAQRVYDGVKLAGEAAA